MKKTHSHVPPFEVGATITLHPRDRAAMRVRPSITTVTFFEGAAPEPVLRARCARLIEANPWLAGRLWSGARSVELVVPASVPPGVCFEVVEQDGDLTPGGPAEQLMSDFLPYTVRRGVDCMDKPNGDLFRVTLVRAAPRFAVVVSVSHVIADGATYYQLVNGLGSDADPPVLEPTRLEAFGALVAETIGEDKIAFKKAPSVTLGILLKLFARSPLGCLPSQKVRAWRVSDAWVAAQKEKHAASAAAATVPFTFVSTNDVVTSWFFSRGAYDYGLMAANLRGRLASLPELDSSRAGNYMEYLHFHPEDYATPSGIRRPLLNGLRSNRPPPSACTNLRSHLAFVTSWASFPFDLAFEGAEQLLHVPVLEIRAVVDTCVIFRPRPRELAVLMLDRLGPAVGEDAAAEPALGARIF